MNALRDAGRFLFAVSIAVFGLQYLLYGRYVGGLAPVPPWVPGGSIGSYLVGVFLIASAMGMLFNRQARLSARSLGLFFLFCVFFLHTWHFRAVVTEGLDRTRALEPLAIAAAAFLLAGTFPKSATPSPAWASFAHRSSRGHVPVSWAADEFCCKTF